MSIKCYFNFKFK